MDRDEIAPLHEKVRHPVWAAAYAHYFSAQVYQQIRDGEGAPVEQTMDGFAEDAFQVADDALAALLRITKP